jgi:hypothetical protein
VAAQVRGGGGTGVPGARRGRRGAGMLTPVHQAGWETRKKGSISTWMARLLVLGCWCYKEHRLLGWVLSSKILAKTTKAEAAVG